MIKIFKMNKVKLILNILILSQFWNCATTLTLWEIDELSHAKNMAIRKNYPNSLKLFEVPDSIETKSMGHSERELH
jgi:hypothetical protein